LTPTSLTLALDLQVEKIIDELHLDVDAGLDFLDCLKVTVPRAAAALCSVSSLFLLPHLPNNLPPSGRQHQLRWPADLHRRIQT